MEMISMALLHGLKERSLVRNLEHLVARSHPIGDLDTDKIPRCGVFDLLVIDLHRIDRLGKIRCMSQNPDFFTHT